MNRAARILLTSTALAPVGLTYSWVAIVSSNLLFGVSAFILSIILFLACIYFIRDAQEKLAKSDFKAVHIEAADHENTAFLLIYLMPLFTEQFEMLQWEFWIPAVVIFAIITATGYNYHFNPMLGLMGWHFYKVQTEEGVTFVLITKKHLRSAASTLQVGQLTEYILLDVGGKNDTDVCSL